MNSNNINIGTNSTDIDQSVNYEDDCLLPGRPSAPLDMCVSSIISGHSLSSLSGLSRAIILAIYQVCKSTGSATTNQVTINYLTSTVRSHPNTIRTVINRLKARQLLHVVTYKRGRGGWVIYRLAQDLYLNIVKTENLNRGNCGPYVDLTPNGRRSH